MPWSIFDGLACTLSRTPSLDLLCRRENAAFLEANDVILSNRVVSSIVTTAAALKTLKETAHASLMTARMPTTRNEAYRFTDLAALVQVSGGSFEVTFREHARLARAVFIC